MPDVSAEVRDMWIPPENNHISTFPSVTIELLSDPIASAINSHCPAEISNRKKHENSENLTIDDNGIRELIKDNNYRAAISLTSRLLSNYGQGINQKGQEIKHSKHSLQLWYTRLYLLLKINELEIARKEGEVFGQLNNHDMFYETQEQVFKSRKGSLPDFAFRLLLAYELPFKLNRPKEALQNLVNMLTTTRKIHKFFKDLDRKSEADFWKEREIRVLCSIINCATHLKNFDLAYQIIQSLLDMQELKEELKFELYSAWGRM